MLTPSAGNLDSGKPYCGAAGQTMLEPRVGFVAPCGHAAAALGLAALALRHRDASRIRKALVVAWLLSVFAVSFGTAVLPVFSSELYLVTVLVTHPELDWWIAGPAAAIGQLLGKAIHYLAALPHLIHTSWWW